VTTGLEKALHHAMSCGVGGTGGYWKDGL